MRRILLVAVLALVGCGGDARQDADEPSGEFKVEVVDASFPRVQHIAENVELKIKVRNGESDESLRNVAVTVETKPRGRGRGARVRAQRPRRRALRRRPADLGARRGARWAATSSP